jgi:hypothetical protein
MTLKLRRMLSINSALIAHITVERNETFSQMGGARARYLDEPSWTWIQFCLGLWIPRTPKQYQHGVLGR